MSNNWTDADLLRLNDEELEFDDDLREYSGSPFTGVAYTTFANGNLEREISCLNGLPNGLCRECYPDGQKRKEWTARRGPVHGVCTEWHSDGSIKSIANYMYGVETSYEEWSEQGALITKRELDEKSPMHGLIAKLDQAYNN